MKSIRKTKIIIKQKSGRLLNNVMTVKTKQRKLKQRVARILTWDEVYYLKNYEDVIVPEDDSDDGYYYDCDGGDGGGGDSVAVQSSALSTSSSSSEPVTALDLFDRFGDWYTIAQSVSISTFNRFEGWYSEGLHIGSPTGSNSN